MDQRTEVPGIFRNESTGALINKDNKSLEAYRKRRQTAKNIPLMEKRIANLEKMVSDLTIRLRALENK
jgi:hypothetical protein